LVLLVNVIGAVQLGGDGEEFSADLAAGCCAISACGRVRHHLIRSSAKGGGDSGAI
jgi:hypothetical protein